VLDWLTYLFVNVQHRFCDVKSTLKTAKKQELQSQVPILNLLLRIFDSIDTALSLLAKPGAQIRGGKFA